MTLDELFTTTQLRLTTMCQRYLMDRTCFAPTLKEAMCYAVNQRGKCTRPILVYLSGFLLDVPFEALDAPACAIELIHTYSLIHDDLPDMDNADLRRGQPACHKAFGPATAILAGDALQPLAFEILATHPAPLSPTQRLEMIATLSHVSGMDGMAAGQSLDLTGAKTPDVLETLCRLKTGALLTACSTMASIAANMPCEWLTHYTQCIGLAFQIQDDLLDVEGNSHDLGKPVGIDPLNKKLNYPAMLGIEQSRHQMTTLFQKAIDGIPFSGEKKQLVTDFTHSLMERKK